MEQGNTGLYKSVAALGNAIALGAALIGTPIIFNLTKELAFLYLAKAWGQGIAWVLVWVLGGIEAYIIYAAISFIFTVGIIWAMTVLAARNFRE